MIEPPKNRQKEANYIHSAITCLSFRTLRWAVIGAFCYCATRATRDLWRQNLPITKLRGSVIGAFCYCATRTTRDLWRQYLPITKLRGSLIGAFCYSPPALRATYSGKTCR